MTKEELIKKGFMEVSNIPHPMGGDYTEAHYFNVRGEYIEQEYAVYVVLKRFMKDGMQVGEEVLFDEDRTLRR
jgi:hypothetical protein